MKNSAGSVFLLLLTSMIWGFAFVAQRKGMEFLDPMTFNGIRFAIGALFVGIIYRIQNKNEQDTNFPVIPGIILFIAASLQQIGMIWTTAGNAGFITGLYVVFVPLIGYFIGHHLRFVHILSVLISVIGIYLISIHQGLKLNTGDILVFLSAIFWALHVMVINRYTRNSNSLHLAFSQYAICALASLAFGFTYILIRRPGTISDLSIFSSIYDASIPIIYGGLLSVGVAYTLQVEAQKRVGPTTSALVLCLESVFAMLGGYLLLQEAVTLRMLSGAFLMLSAMIISSTAYARESMKLNS